MRFSQLVRGYDLSMHCFNIPIHFIRIRYRNLLLLLVPIVSIVVCGLSTGTSYFLSLSKLSSTITGKATVFCVETGPVTLFSESTNGIFTVTLYKIAIYGPMIYTALYVQ
jgi:hypothetical protein